MENELPKIQSKIPTRDELQFLEDMVHEHNSLRTGRTDGKLYAKFIRDAENRIIAGISGWTWAGACEISLLWVHRAHRKMGYGQMLLNAAETEAKKETCSVIVLRTFSFQAPRFYHKQGYKLEHEINDFPTGHSEFVMVKRMGK